VVGCFNNAFTDCQAYIEAESQQALRVIDSIVQFICVEEFDS